MPHTIANIAPEVCKNLAGHAGLLYYGQCSRLTPKLWYSMIAFDEARFAHETIEGETMIIDTVHGRLIMVSGGGPFVLECLRQGTSRHDLIEKIADRFGREAGDRASAFIDEMMTIGVLVESDRLNNSEQVSEAEPSPKVQVDWPESIAPMIERYDDIAEIIAMDPIHDVSNAGWPRKIT